MKVRYDAAYKAAVACGCSPKWYDGIFGWTWHCSCEDNRHGCDQQCSTITTKSALRGSHDQI